jgi:hypothetical protein
VNFLTKLGVAITLAALLVGLVVAVYPETGPKSEDPSFWAWVLLSISVSMHLLLIPTPPDNKVDPLGPVNAIESLVGKLKKDITPPTLAFLALARQFRYASQFGEEVGRLNSQWQNPDPEWQKRASLLEEKGLMDRSGSEYACSRLGILFVVTALNDPHYSEVASYLRSAKWFPV